MVISTQPTAILTARYPIEIERSLNSTLTIGIAASHLVDAEDEYREMRLTTADLKLRYYPSARPFEGISIAISGGIGRLVEHDADLGHFDQTGASIGTFFDYGWLLGPTKQFQFALGAGAKALFIDYDTGFGTFNLRYPTVRLSVGIGF